MSTEAKSSVQTHWLAGQLLGFNCISYGNDAVTLLNIYAVASGDNQQIKKHYAFPVADTTVGSLEKYNDDIWAEIQLYNAQVKTGNLTISCGEGAMGNEGVMVATTDDNKLIWALFSTESNPFLRLEIADEQLLAYSDTQLYTINLTDLTKIAIRQINYDY